MSYVSQKLAEEEYTRALGGFAFLVTAASANKLVTSTAMKNGAYTIAAQPVSPALLSVTVSAVSTADTMGKITFVGKDIYGADQTEEVIPSAAAVVYTTKMFASVVSITGSGWTAAATADNITVGVAGIVPPAGYATHKLQVLATTAVSAQATLAGVVAPNLVSAGNLPVGDYPLRCSALTLSSGTAIVHFVKL